MGALGDFEVVSDCLVCGRGEGVVDRRFGAMLALEPPYSVLRCSVCGLRWLSPRPSQEKYRELYTEERYFGGTHSVEDFAAVASSREDYFAKRVRRIEKQLGGRTRLFMLDIGAATGEFVVKAIERGHLAQGLEFSADARQLALSRHGVALAPPDTDSLPSSHFDAIHMNHVFEHLPDPVATLRECSRLLKRGGLLVIEVPQQLLNDLDRVRRMLFPWRHPEFTSYSLHHTYFFTPETLERLLEQSGFQVGSMTTANWDRTPLWPPVLKNWVLGPFLWLADKLHQGGNIIEVYAKKV